MDIFSRKNIAILLLLSAVALLSFPRVSRAETPVEEKVKAAFIVNFARFISWPEELFSKDTDPFVICTVGMDTEGAAFTGIESKKIKGRPIVLKNLTSLDDKKQICQLLYVKGGE